MATEIEENNQGDLFALPKFDIQGFLLADDGKPNVIIIGCGRHKKDHPTFARDLYSSKRFNTSKEIAKNIDADYFILSAKHGLITPNQIIEPYDFEISELNKKEKDYWADSILKLIRDSKNGATVTILAEDSYTDIIKSRNEPHYNVNIKTPFSKLLPEQIPLWLDCAEKLSIRIRDLKRLYTHIEAARKKDLTFNFSELPNKKLAKRGVYIFLDPNKKNFLQTGPRIVRIGTHAVSLDSKSTLKNRLRSHFGQNDGGGNHRGSIFRLHVGTALLESKKLCYKQDFWGKGQHAPIEIRKAEEEVEKQVSTYLSRLEIFVIPINDEPSKDSLRAHIETQLIALCTEDLQPIDTPEPKWLGFHSPMSPIVKSGLWNLRDVAKKYKPNEPGSISHLLSLLEHT